MKKQTLQESAYQEIAGRIAGGAFAPGQWLREQHIAEDLAISPTPVREAFRRLEREGWLEFVPRRGCRIRVPTTQDIADMYVMREGMEVVGIRLAVDRATEKDWRTIETAADRFEHACRDAVSAAGDETAFEAPIESDFAFHMSLVAATHSDRIVQAVQTAHLQTDTMVASKFCTPDAEHMLTAAAEHVAICRAMRTGQVRAAEELLRAHIADAGQRVVEALEKYDTGETPRPAPKLGKLVPTVGAASS